MIIVKQEVVKERDERIGLKREERMILKEKKTCSCSRSHLCQRMREIKRFSGDERTTTTDTHTDGISL